MAVQAHVYLLAHEHPPALPRAVPSLPFEAGEYAVGLFERAAGVHLEYARYAGTVVTYRTSPAVAVGSPGFVAGFTLGTLFLRARARRRAARESVPRWWPTPLLCTVVTTRRLWCRIGEPGRAPRWVHFTYDHITDLALVDDVLTVAFELGEPLRLAGPWAPWCAAVMAHYRYGSAAGAAVSALHEAAFAR